MRSIFIQQADLPQVSYFLHYLRQRADQWTVYCSVSSPARLDALRKTYPDFAFVERQQDVEAAVAACDSYVLVADLVAETLRLLELIKQREQ